MLTMTTPTLDTDHDPKVTDRQIAQAKEAGVELAAKRPPPDWEVLTKVLVVHDGEACMGTAMALALRVLLDRVERENAVLRDRVDDLARELSVHWEKSNAERL